MFKKEKSLSILLEKYENNEITDDQFMHYSDLIEEKCSNESSCSSESSCSKESPCSKESSSDCSSESSCSKESPCSKESSSEEKNKSSVINNMRKRGKVDLDENDNLVYKKTNGETCSIKDIKESLDYYANISNDIPDLIIAIESDYNNNILSYDEYETLIDFTYEAVSAQEKENRKKIKNHIKEAEKNSPRMQRKEKERNLIDKRIDRNEKKDIKNNDKAMSKERKKLNKLKDKRIKEERDSAIIVRSKTEFDNAENKVNSENDAKISKMDNTNNIKAKANVLKNMNKRGRLGVDTNDKMYYKKNDGRRKAIKESFDEYLVLNNTFEDALDNIDEDYENGLLSYEEFVSLYEYSEAFFEE